MYAAELEPICCMKASQRRDGISPVLRFLRSRRSYPEPPERIQLLQTHASWVAVTERFVYKVKKPVDFGFLDFSTLEKRRHFCEREVTLNRRLCPDAYLGVIPIRRNGRRWRFDGDGEIVEYAVKMKRLATSDFLLEMLKDGRLTRRHIDRVIATLRQFYSQTGETRHLAKWDGVAGLRENTAENFRQVKAFFGVTITRSAWDAIGSYTEQFYRQHGALFRARAREGRIRDCHGDLHLEHIHMAPDKVRIYDCIEFNDRFRLIDVANDLAFLAMDLDFHGRADLGRYLVTRMAKGLRDPGMLQVLDFYKCYRACVRGKVESFRSKALGVSRREQVESRKLAQQYFRLALQYAICGSAPMVIIVMGHVAVGKSTLARALADELGCNVFSSDRLRKELAGVPLRVRGSAQDRARLYSSGMSRRTYAALFRGAVGEIRHGRNVVLDATFAQRRRRDALCAKLQKAHIDYCFVELRASRSTVRQRLAAREYSRNEFSDARLEDFPALERAYESPKEVDSRHCLSIRVAGAPAGTLTVILQGLARRRATHLA